MVWRYLPLVWSAICRNKVRSGLTLISVALAFTLFGLLHGVSTVFQASIDQQRLDRLIVQARDIEPLPVSYLSQIQKIPGIDTGVQNAFLWGYYRNPSDQVFVIATEPSSWLNIWSEYRVEPGRLAAFMKVKTGVLVSEGLRRQYGWKIGDRFSVRTEDLNKDGSMDWPFEVMGYISERERARDPKFCLAHYSYVDQFRLEGASTANRFVLRVKDVRQSAAIGSRIDALFKNSSVPTRTQSEKELGQAILSRMGNVSAFTRAILTALFFTLLVLTLNAMAESVRERTCELAILKTFGFSNILLTMLLCLESAIITLTGAAIGLAAADLLFPLAKAYVAEAPLPPSVIFWGLAAAVAVAIVTAIPSAFRLSRLQVTEALAYR